MLAAYYPTANMPDATIRAWAPELLRFDPSVAAEAVQTLARSQPRLPSLAELIDTIGKAQRRMELDRATTRGLEAPRAPATGMMPADVRRRLEALGFGNVARDLPAEAS